MDGAGQGAPWPMLATRQTTVATLLRLRGVSWRSAPIERGALRIWGSGSSLSSPPGSHRRSQLLTTFRCEVELFLHFFGSTWRFRGGRRLFLLMGSCGNVGSLARLSSGSGRFTLSLSRCCSKLLFQLGELLCTFLLASFEPPDLFLETFTLIHMDEEMFRRPLMRMTDLIPR